jgi:4-hydroxybutyryl-CoA dehydratase/vinylacetyl-CoA-Delta-isomerase
MVETGCFPSSRDFSDAQLGPLIQKYLAGAGEAEERARIARLAEWLTIGAGVPGCMHGGGSPASARLVLRAQVPWDRYEAYAANLAGVQNMGGTTRVSKGV